MRIGCPSPACKISAHTCEKNTYTLPFYDVINPALAYPSLPCTNSSKSGKCPCKCEFDKNLNRCVPMTEQDFCGKKINHICPTGCKYNTTQNKCIQSLNIYLCEIDRNVYPPRCPIGCSYDYNICMGPGCDKKIQLVCDAECKHGACCGGKGYECEASGFNRDEMNTCETSIRAKCPDGYKFDIDAPLCSRFNRNNLCKVDEKIIEYPSRLSQEIGIIQCKLIREINCTDINYIIEKCPTGCKLDIYTNKCISDNKNILCGSNLLTCPTNKIYNGHCYFDESRSSICPENQILFNVNGVTQNYSLCGYRWYYE